MSKFSIKIFNQKKYKGMRTVLDEIISPPNLKPSIPTSSQTRQPGSVPRGAVASTVQPLPATASLNALEIFTAQFVNTKIGSNMSQIAIILESWIRFAEHYNLPIQFVGWDNCEERETVIARKDFPSVGPFIGAVVRNVGTKMLIRNTGGLIGRLTPNSGDVLIWKFKDKTTGECLRQKSVRLVYSLWPIIQGYPSHNEQFNILERDATGRLKFTLTPTASNLRKPQNVKIGGKTYEKTMPPSSRTVRRFKGFMGLK
ncbi:MAG: hypothetical protein ACKVT2_22395 [Saprospiraceae bacterium]